MIRPVLTFGLLCTVAVAEERPSVKCIENSPERRGEEGCSILSARPLVGSPGAAYWHIDRYDSLEAATKAASPDGVAAQAHGAAWLMTVEPRSEEHRGGHHVAWVGPLELPPAAGYTMRVQSSRLEPGSTTPIHTHSGPEAFYVVGGEQCLETAAAGLHLRVGETRVIPAGQIHRGRIIGKTPRQVLALVLHDSSQPASHDLTDPPALVPCR